jgi:hypothetical protein
MRRLCDFNEEPAPNTGDAGEEDPTGDDVIVIDSDSDAE